MNDFLKKLEINFNNWCLYLVMGIVFGLTGIWGAIEKRNGLEIFYIFLIILILVSGSLKIIFSILDRNIINNWKGSMINGIIVLCLGSLLIYLNLSVKTIVLIVGVLQLRYAYNSIIHSFQLKDYIKYWKWFGLFSIINGVYAILTIMSTQFSKSAQVYFATLTFIFLGSFDIIYAYVYKDIQKNKNDGYKEKNKL